jgi:hypothetical protein
LCFTGFAYCARWPVLLAAARDHLGSPGTRYRNTGGRVQASWRHCRTHHTPRRYAVRCPCGVSNWSRRCTQPSSCARAVTHAGRRAVIIGLVGAHRHVGSREKQGLDLQPLTFRSSPSRRSRPHKRPSRSAAPWSKQDCLGTRACWQRRSPDCSLRPVHGGDSAGIAVPGIDLSRSPAHRSRFIIHNCYVNLRHGEEGPVTAKLRVLATTTGAAMDGGEQP